MRIYSNGGGGGGGGSGTSILGQVPGLRLSLTTAVPVTTADVTGATTIYYTPCLHGNVATYDSGAWALHTTDEISLALGTLASGKNYDVFAYWTGSALALELSAAWTNSTTRANALARQDGVLVKSADHSRRYVGTFFTTATTTTEDSVANRYVFNQYNRVPRPLSVIDTTDSWASAAAGWRASNNSAANSFNYTTGDVGTHLRARAVNLSTGTGGASAGVGIDSVSTNSAQVYGSDTSTFGPTGGADYSGFPGLGKHTITWLESGGVGITFYGDNANAFQQTGMTGEILA